MQKLSGLDAVFLHAETPRTPMNVVATIVLDADASERLGADPRQTVLDRLRDRIPHMPPFRRKLALTPLSLDQPAWIEDSAFELEDHVLHTIAPGAGSDEDLERLVGRIAQQPLDRTRPLWELWVVEGLADGAIALVTKAHHAALDGVSGAALLLHLFDRPEGAGGSAPTPWTGEDEPSASTLLYGAAARLGERGRELVHAAHEAGAGIGRVLQSRVSASPPLRDAALPFTAPPTSFCGSVSARRGVAYASTPLDSIATIRSAFGGTLNDVVLAACTSALRDYLIARNELPEVPLVASIPISTRDAGDAPGGNHISAMLAALPVQIDDAEHRYWEVCRASRNAKRFHGLLGRHTLAALAELSPGPLIGSALRAYSAWGLASLHRPLHNLVISNVAGPPTPLHFAGSTVRALHPHGPLMDGAGLNITVMSYAGSLDVGVLACRESVPQVRALAEGVAAAVENLAERAETEIAGKRPRSRLRVAS